MNKNEHIRRHIKLHNSLDELLADFLTHTNKWPSKTTVTEFVEWSHPQKVNPTEEE